MQNVELRHLAISPRYRAYLLKAQFITAAEVLLTPTHLLRSRTNLSPLEIDSLVQQVSQAVLELPLTRSQSILELTRDAPPRDKISLRDDRLDELLAGGVRLGSVTEIAGQSASGKTHLCLQLALNVQLDPSQGGLSGGALFISSEGTLSSTRLLDLAHHLVERTQDDSTSTLRRRTKWDFLDNVHIEKSPDYDTLEAVLSYHVPARIERINELSQSNTIDPDLSSLLSHQPEHQASLEAPPVSQFLSENRHSSPHPPLPIHLVLLDSIAAPLRSTHETASSGFVERAKQLSELGDRLKRIANVYNVAVVVVNQVQDVFERMGPLPSHLLVEEEEEENGTITRGDEGLSSPYPISSSRTSSTSRSSTTSSTYHNNHNNLYYTPSATSSSTTSSSTILPPPHIQYTFPIDLYTRFQSGHSSGASSTTFSSGGGGGGGGIAATLGNSWTNLINTRILTRVLGGRYYQDDEDSSSESEEEEEGGGGGALGIGSEETRGERNRGRRKKRKKRLKQKREMIVIFGPDVVRSRIEYVLDRKRGVKSCSDVRYRESCFDLDDGGEEGNQREDVVEGGEGGGANVAMDVEGDGEGDDADMFTREWEQVAATLEV